MLRKTNLKHRLLMSGWHLLCSLLVAAAVAFVAFGIWYPEPFGDLSSGFRLFAILVIVDVFLGPLATAVVSSPGKNSRELFLDIVLIVLLQLGALSYGVWTIFEARPVYIVYEIDRFRVVHAFEVADDLLVNAPQEFRELPRLGPEMLAVRDFESISENQEATMAALLGIELSFRPDLWERYDHAHVAVRDSLMPISTLFTLHPDNESDVRLTLKKRNLPQEKAGYLPLHSRARIWTAVVDTDTLKPTFYLDIDPYDP